MATHLTSHVMQAWSRGTPAPPSRARRGRVCAFARRRWMAPALLAMVALSLLTTGCAITPGGLPGLPAVPVLTIVTTSVANAFTGTAYTAAIDTTGGVPPLSDCRVVAGAMPTGLSVAPDPTNRSRCLITGTVDAAAAPGIYDFTIRAADSSSPALSDTQDYSMTLLPGFRITDFDFPNGTVNRQYMNFKIVTSGGTTPIQCFDRPIDAQGNPIGASTLPPGLNVAVVDAGRNCQVSGTPTTDGLFSVTISARDSGMPPSSPPINAAVVEDFLVNAVLDITSTSPLPEATRLVAYNFAFTRVGGNGPPFTWNIVSGPFTGNVGNAGTACEGLSLDPPNSRFLVGTPVNAGTCSFRVRVDDNPALDANMNTIVNAGFDEQDFTLVVNNPSPTITAINPVMGNRLETLDIAVTGTNFFNTATALDGMNTNNGVTRLDFGPDVTVNSVTVNSRTSLTANITIASTAALGARDVTVSNQAPVLAPGTDTLAGAFTINNPAPALAAVDPLTPASAARLDTLDVIISGNTNFINGVTICDFGPDITVNSCVVDTPTQITANITIGATAATGPRDVTVTNPPPGGGTATAANAFTIANPSPTLTMINPTSGNRLQTLDVDFTGDDFIQGVTSVDFGPDILVNAVTVNTPTSLTANITITGLAATGPRDVTVTNAAPVEAPGSATLANAFQVNNPAPTVTNINPATGNRLATLNVVFTGTNFLAGVTSVDFGAGITLNTLSVDTTTQLTANITIASTAATGSRNVTVTNAAPGGGSAMIAFNVENPPPTITNINPTQGFRLDANLMVVLTGTGYINGVSTVDFGGDIVLNSFTVDSATQITADITIPETAATGLRQVTVTNAGPGGGMAPIDFTVLNPSPTITMVTPDTANLLQTLTVVLTGTKFISGVSTPSFSGGITVNNFTVDSNTQITANITVPSGAGSFSGFGSAFDPAVVSRSATVSNSGPGGGFFSSTFNVINIGVSNITPNSGGRTQTINVTIDGANFDSFFNFFPPFAPAVSFSGTGITVNSVTAFFPSQAIANITIDAAATLGPRDLTVTNTGNGASVTVPGAFSVENPAPTITSLTPDNGAIFATNLDVIIAGTGFIDGVTSVDFGAGITLNSLTVNSSTMMTANIDITAAAAAGPRNVTATNPGPGGGMAMAMFTVNNPSPTITMINPTSGGRTETLDVDVTGTNFIQGTTGVTFSGMGVTVNTVTVASPTMLTANISIAANAATGARDVTVTNGAPGGGSDTLAGAFTIENPLPTLTTVNPNSGNRLQTLDVDLTGTGFVDNVVTTVDFGGGITVNTTTVNSSTSITANITITSLAATGARDVIVTNAGPGGGVATLMNGFTVNNPAPTLTMINPAMANLADTLNVDFTGTNFVPGTSVSFSGTGIAVNSVTVNSDTMLTANITVLESATPGARDVSVTNAAPGGGTATLAGGFTVGAIGIQNTGLDTGYVGSSYTQNFVAAGGTAPFSWAITDGAFFMSNAGVVTTPCENLSLDTNTGVLTTGAMNLMNAGTCGPFTVTVTDAMARSASKVFSIQVSAAGTFTITTASPLGDGVEGRAFSQLLATAARTGDVTACTIVGGAPPPGMGVRLEQVANPTACEVFGNPSQAGTFGFTVQATDSLPATAQRAYVVTIQPPLMVVNTFVLNGLKGSPFRYVLRATGGIPPYTWDEMGANLNTGNCAGIATIANIGATDFGVAAGTPTGTGACNFTARVTDTASASTMSASATQALSTRIVDSLAFVANLTATTVVPISPATMTPFISAGTAIDTGDATAGTFLLATTPDGRFVYVANNGATGHTISVIDTSTLMVTRTFTSADDIQTGANDPNAVLATPPELSGGMVTYVVGVVNRGSNSIQGIDGAQDPSTATVDTPIASPASNTGPFAGGITPDGALVFIAHFSSDTVCVFDANAGAYLDVDSGTMGTQCIAVEGGPRFVAVSPDGRFAFVSNQTGGANSTGSVSIIAVANVLDGNPANDVVQTIDLSDHDRGGVNNNCTPGVPAVSLDGLRVLVPCRSTDDYAELTVLTSDATFTNVVSTTVNFFHLAAGGLNADSPFGATFMDDANALISNESHHISRVTPANAVTELLLAGSPGPRGVDAIRNPSLSFSTGGNAPADPFVLPGATIANEYRVPIVARGGIGPYNFNEVTANLGAGACTGFSLNTNTGLITKPAATGMAGNCDFTVRVSDSQNPQQFVDRNFRIVVP